MRVLLVEDDAALAAAMCAYLDGKSFAVDRAGSLAAAGAALPLAPWQAVLLDRIHLKSALMEALYGFDDEVGSNTVEVFVHNLRRKLGPDSIQTGRGLGCRLCGSTG